MNPTVYFDLETGGVEEKHPDIQIAAIAVGPDWNELATFEAKIQFVESEADPEALKLNHYNREVWSKVALPLSRVVPAFGEWLRPYASVEKKSRAGSVYRVARLAGHNAATFDGPRLQRMFKSTGQFLAADYQVLDTLQLALWKFDRAAKRPENLKLGTLAAYFGIPMNGAHDALTDVRTCAAVARALLNGGAS